MIMPRAAVFAAFAALLSLSGCRSMFGDDGGGRDSSAEVTRTVDEVETQAKEVQTRTALAKMEEALGAYVKHERKIPEKLSDLVPKYLAEIPTVEGVRSHRETNRVRVYPSSVLRDGQVDGTALRDSGAWGYVFNDRQVVVFVDCTHKATDGRAWYLER